MLSPPSIIPKLNLCDCLRTEQVSQELRQDATTYRLSSFQSRVPPSSLSSRCCRPYQLVAKGCATKRRLTLIRIQFAELQGEYSPKRGIFRLRCVTNGVRVEESKDFRLVEAAINDMHISDTSRNHLGLPTTVGRSKQGLESLTAGGGGGCEDKKSYK